MSQKDPDREIWYIPDFRWYHWILVVAWAVASFLRNISQSHIITMEGMIGNFLGSLVGAALFVYFLLAIWNWLSEKGRYGDEEIHEEWT